MRVYNCSHPAEDRKSEPSVASSVAEAVETLFGAMLGRGKQMTELSKQVCQHSTPLPFKIVTLYRSLLRYLESSFTWPFKKNTIMTKHNMRTLGVSRYFELKTTTIKQQLNREKLDVGYSLIWAGFVILFSCPVFGRMLECLHDNDVPCNKNV